MVSVHLTILDTLQGGVDKSVLMGLCSRDMVFCCSLSYMKGTFQKSTPKPYSLYSPGPLVYGEVEQTLPPADATCTPVGVWIREKQGLRVARE